MPVQELHRLVTQMREMHKIALKAIENNRLADLASIYLDALSLSDEWGADVLPSICIKHLG